MNSAIVIEIICEGPTDFQVLRAVLIHHCQVPPDVTFLYKRFGTLPGKRLWDKVETARFQAGVSKYAVCVFVLDTEGKPSLMNDLIRGRNARAGLPMPLGEAHPCIEAWLLVDATAIKRGLNLMKRPTTPVQPETIATANEAKMHLASYSTQKVKELSVAEKAEIAIHIHWPTVAQTCQAFAAFDAELTTHIRALFLIPSNPAETLDASTTP